MRDWNLLKCYAAREPAWSWGLIVTNAVKKCQTYILNKHSVYTAGNFRFHGVHLWHRAGVKGWYLHNWSGEDEGIQLSFRQWWHGVWHKITSPLTTRPDSVTLFVSRIVLEVSGWQCRCVDCLGQERLLGISTQAREKRERGHSRIHSLRLSSSWITPVVYWVRTCWVDSLFRLEIVFADSRLGPPRRDMVAVATKNGAFHLPFMVCCALQSQPGIHLLLFLLDTSTSKKLQVNKYYRSKVHVMMTRSHKIHL